MSTQQLNIFGGVSEIKQRVYFRDKLGRFASKTQYNQIERLNESIATLQTQLEMYKRMYEAIANDNVAKEKELANIKQTIKQLI